MTQGLVDFFDEDFGRYVLSPQTVSHALVDFLTEKLHLSKGSHVLDQCCGIGRVSTALTHAGYHVTGIDFVQEYIDQAQNDCPNATFITGDAEKHVFDRKFDAVLNWWTSFGYHKTDVENQRLLKSAFDALNPGGYFALDIPNALFYSAQDEYPITHDHISNGCHLRWVTKLSDDKRILFKDIEYIKNNDVFKKSQGHGVRLYTPMEIKALLHDTGFENIYFYGDETGGAYHKFSSRCIVIAKKPKGKKTSLFSHVKPQDNFDFRQSIYNGDIYKIENSAFAKYIQEYVWEKLKNIYGDNIQNIHENDHVDMLQMAQGLKDALKTDEEYHLMQRALLIEQGFLPQENALDAIRLRINMSGGYKNDGARAAYAIHRDTWYANPSAQINWWIALHDIDEEQGFLFYPSYFSIPVNNNSKDFDYTKWIAGGWSATSDDVSADGVPFSCMAGDIILFSAAHLHGTNPHDTAFTRFSLDFRSVHVFDHEADLGAMNVDNDSPPLAMDDYKIITGGGASS